MGLGLLNKDRVLGGYCILGVRDNRRKGLVLGGVESEFGFVQLMMSFVILKFYCNNFRRRRTRFKRGVR